MDGATRKWFTKKWPIPPAGAPYITSTAAGRPRALFCEPGGCCPFLLSCRPRAVRRPAIRSSICRTFRWKDCRSSHACTDSSLDLFDWLKLENINRDLFRINVRNMTYRRYHPFGHPQPWWKKVIVQGGGLFLLLLSILLVPFFIFSTSNPQVGVNPVYSASLNLTVATNDSTAVYPIFSGGYRASA